MAFTELAAWIVAFVVVVRLLKNVNNWIYEPRLANGQAPLPPGDMGWPLIGNMVAFLGAFQSGNPQAFIGRYIAKYKRIGIYKAFMFNQATVLATTPEACKLVLTNDNLFVTGWPEATIKLVGRKGFTSLGPEEHKRLRRLTAASINGQGAFQKYLPRIERISREALDSWAEKSEIRFLTEVRKVTFSVIADSFLSLKPGPLSDAIEKEYQDLNLGLRALAINLPGTAYNRALKARNKLIKYIQTIIDERKMSGEIKHDVLQDLLDAQDEDGNHLTDEEAIDVIIMYLNAGHESSAHTCMWAMHLLHKNPDVHSKVLDEQLKIREGKKPGECLTLAEYRRMTYLFKVIEETLRVINLAPMVFRKALKDVNFNGYTIPKGWHVQCWMRQVHLDPEVYPDPFRFNPDRWENCTPKTGMFIPFGAGSRLCPGRDLAMLEISVFLHLMLACYTFEPLNPNARVIYLPHPRPADYAPSRVRRRQNGVA